MWAMGFADRFLGWVGRVELGLCVAMVIAIVVAVALQVITRTFFNLPLGWVEEFAGFCFVWSTFLGASVALKQFRHIGIKTFIARLGPTTEALVRAVTYALITYVLVVLVYESWGIIPIESRSNSVGLPIRIPRSVFFSVPLFTSAILMVVTAAYLCLAFLIQAATGVGVEPVGGRMEPASAADEFDEIRLSGPDS